MSSRSVALRVAVTITLAPTSACKTQPEPQGELVDVGSIGASLEPAPGVHAPIARGDLAAISETGRWLHQARRALELADAAIIERMGKIDDDVVLPLVDIDPGGASGQVVFVRWPNSALAHEPLQVANAQRWALVALMFEPERVLDVELLHGAPEPGSDEARRIEALLVGATALQRAAPKQAFFTIDRFVEEPVTEKKRKSRIATVIYALAQDPQGPDLELGVEEASKRAKQPPPLLRATTIHAKGALANDPVAVQWPDPHPLSIARALERDPQGPAMSVRVGSGLYRIAIADGRVERVGP